MFLFLNSRYEQSVMVGLKVGTHEPHWWQYVRGEEPLFVFLTNRINEEKTAIKNIRGIIVVPGPGGFSNVRTVAVISNAISFAGHIPTVAAIPRADETISKIFERGIRKLRKRKRFAFRPVQPVYGQQPNITKPKKKKPACVVDSFLEK